MATIAPQMVMMDKQPRFFHQPNIPTMPLANRNVGGSPFVRPVMKPVELHTFDGKRMRKAVARRTVDYNSAVIKYLQYRTRYKDFEEQKAVQPDTLYQLELTTPFMERLNPMNAVTTRFMRASANKIRSPIFCVSWTPEGRRLITGSSRGEFTLWNGLAFNFETILQAHDEAVRAMVWSHSDMWMVTGDHLGYIKYWQNNMNNVKMFQAHKEPLRGISFSPTDIKITTCSDDSTVRIWDFIRCHEETILRGHGADVKCVDWHPQKGLIASGSKDNQQPIKLWDPRSGSGLCTIYGHKGTVMSLKWNMNGNWLLTSSRDHLLKLWDIRNLKEEFQTFKGHKREATVVSWHPVHEKLFVSGSWDGAVMFWMAGADKEVGFMEQAHDSMVWSLAWHPMGHLLASASNDHTTKFWARNRPGDKMRDKYNLNTMPVMSDQDLMDSEYDHSSSVSLLPGMGIENVGDQNKDENENKDGKSPEIPGLSWDEDIEEKKKVQLNVEIQKIQRQKQTVQRPVSKFAEMAWREFGMDQIRQADNQRPPAPRIPTQDMQRPPLLQQMNPRFPQNENMQRNIAPQRFAPAQRPGLLRNPNQMHRVIGPNVPAPSEALLPLPNRLPIPVPNPPSDENIRFSGDNDFRGQMPQNAPMWQGPEQPRANPDRDFRFHQPFNHPQDINHRQQFDQHQDTDRRQFEQHQDTDRRQFEQHQDTDRRQQFEQHQDTDRRQFEQHQDTDHRQQIPPSHDVDERSRMNEQWTNQEQFSNSNSDRGRTPNQNWSRGTFHRDMYHVERRVDNFDGRSIGRGDHSFNFHENKHTWSNPEYNEHKLNRMYRGRGLVPGRGEGRSRSRGFRGHMRGM